MFFVLPVLVVIKITPFLPSVPYKVVAARPLRMSIFSILFGTICLCKVLIVTRLVNSCIYKERRV